ncbi:MAG: hypothetical protein ACHP7D_01695 [Lysobacterales bacterium]
MSDPRDRDLDHLLGDDGGEFGALYRRLPRMEPPRRLDRSVLGEAVRAVHGRTPRGQRWIVGLGSAAGVVLAAGIAWHVGHDALRQSAQDTFRDAPQVVPVEPITGVARHKREPAIEAQNEAAPPPAASMPAPPLKKSEHPRAAAKPLPAPAPPLRAPASPAQPVPSAAPPAAFPADAAQREEKAQAAEAGAATGAAGTRSAPASDALDQAMSPRQRAGFAPAPSSSVELRRDLQLEPVDWLAHIRQLLHQGRRQQAIESLRLFHRAHPDWQLPDELRPLLD